MRIPRALDSADYLTVARRFPTSSSSKTYTFKANEVVSEGQDAEGEKEEEGEQDQANDIVGNLEAQADQKEGDGDESMEEDGGSDGGDGEGADAEA